MLIIYQRVPGSLEQSEVLVESAVARAFGLTILYCIRGVVIAMLSIRAVLMLESNAKDGKLATRLCFMPAVLRGEMKSPAKL